MISGLKGREERIKEIPMTPQETISVILLGKNLPKNPFIITPSRGKKRTSQL